MLSLYLGEEEFQLYLDTLKERQDESGAYVYRINNKDISVPLN